MGQIAQQDNLYFSPASGDFENLTQAEQNWLVQKAEQGIGRDVVFSVPANSENSEGTISIYPLGVWVGKTDGIRCATYLLYDITVEVSFEEIEEEI